MNVLTIITVSAYDLVRLRRTVESLIEIDCFIEHLIVLPQSDKESINYLEDKIQEYPATKLRFIHDNGQGIYQAMTLGAANATSKYFTFWNSGDVLYSKRNLFALAQELQLSDNFWILTNGFFSWTDYPKPSIDNLVKFINQEVDGYVSHQCVIFHKTVGELGPLFDDRYLVAADTDQIYRLYQSGLPKFLDLCVVSVEFGEFSSVNHRRARLEIFFIVIRRMRGLDRVHALLRLLVRNVQFLARKLKINV